MKWIFVLLLFGLFVPVRMAWSGSTVIHVETETGGDIDVGAADGIFENVDGALFWNGSGWGVNDTYGHMYFTDLSTGQRIKNFTTTAAPSSAAGDGVEILRAPGPTGMEYRAVHNRHTYLKEYGGNTYAITAAEIIVSMVQSGTDVLSGPRVVLRSRSADVSLITPYLEVYIQNEDGSTEAFRGDPVWYSYPMSLEQALLRTDPVEYRKGFLPTLNSKYWLDIDGGSEMGGKTFKLITGGFSNRELDRLSTSFITQMAVQYTDAVGVLRELLFGAHVYSIQAVTFLPLVIK